MSSVEPTRHRHRASGASLRLDRAIPGARCRILRLAARGPVRQRLLDMGLLPGMPVSLVRRAPLGDPLEIRVGDGESFIAIRQAEAEQVHVVPEP
ncbi:FeoA family protein [Thioalkalivibrio nitratireducens]|uniref:FeoA family protein n=1 Tax=Thioalkalivibrio nitratireducens TaxID=186931 RepID=UPI0009F8BEEA|nr:FeoA family protein [Thioalkalivibrio nitratireducens]